MREGFSTDVRLSSSQAAEVVAGEAEEVVAAEAEDELQGKERPGEGEEVVAGEFQASHVGAERMLMVVVMDVLLAEAMVVGDGVKVVDSGMEEDVG